jgi:hypothetical protein
LQFAETPATELRESLSRANAKLRQLDSLRRSLMAGHSHPIDVRELNHEELGKLRRELFELQTELRAELRRRGET